MKKFLAVLLACFVLFTFSACRSVNSGVTASTAQTGSTAAATTAATTAAAETTAAETETQAPATEEPTTVYYEPVHINPEVITGAPGSAAKTYTGYEPLPEVSFTVIDPENTRGLSTKANGFGFGLGKNGSQPAESISNQNLFDQYDALALDRTSPGKILHLTFDCGYENGYTGKILDVLKEKHVQAAFFCTLPFIKSEPELVARMIAEGHIVGNHSTTHPVFPNISRTKMAMEIQNCDNYLRTNFGYSAPFFRFPEGSYSKNSLDLVQSIGYKSVFWSVAYADWDPANQKGTRFAVETVTSRLHPGAVILLHAVSKDNAAALGEIIDRARELGYIFKSL